MHNTSRDHFANAVCDANIFLTKTLCNNEQLPVCLLILLPNQNIFYFEELMLLLCFLQLSVGSYQGCSRGQDFRDQDRGRDMGSRDQDRDRGHYN